MSRVPTRDAAAERRRDESLQRLAAAAALEEAAGVKPLDAWRLAGDMPATVRLQLAAANRNPIRAKASEDVGRIVQDFRARAAGNL